MESLTKDALVKAILYEAEDYNNISQKVKPGSYPILNHHIQIIDELTDFYVNSSRFWSYIIKIKIQGTQAEETNQKYAEMMNWLNENKIPYMYKIVKNRNQSPKLYEFSFINKDGAATFKLRFVE